MKKKNGTILYIGGFELPDKNAAAHRVLNNSKILRNMNYNIVFIGIDKEMEKNKNIFETKKNVQGFISYSISYPKSKHEWIKYLSNIDEYIKIIESIDDIIAVIFYNFQSIAMYKLMKYCKKRGIHNIADVTEWRSSKGENITYRILKDTDTWIRMHILHKKMDGLILISEYLFKYYNKIENRICVPTLMDLSEDKWKNEYTKSNDKLYLVYAGNPGFKDKLNILIEAVSLLEREYQLDIIGITEEQFLKMYPQYLNLKNNKKIIFHGRLPHLETLEYIKKANYSCFFRENDRVTNAGFPTKLAESISCGTPVITNNTSNIKEYVFDLINGVCLENLNINNIVYTLNKTPLIMDTETKRFDYNNFCDCFNNISI